MPSGYVYRLPTEAEREYACRAGTTTRLFYGDDLTYAEVGLYAWCAANSGSYTHPVGQKQANPWGLYDMIGNAWEWCFDWWGSLPGGKVTDPVGPVGPTWGHVLKGSDCYQPGATCRSAHRNPDQPTTQSTTIGFRVVLAPILP